MKSQQTRFQDLDSHRLVVSHFEEYISVLYQDEFTVRDIDDERAKHTLNHLRATGVITDTGYTNVPRHGEHGRERVKTYEWKPGVQEKLQAYHEERDELPCGHRLHIHNPKHTDKYGCKFCDAEYSADAIKALL